MIELRNYVDSRGRSPFERWLERLDTDAAARIVMGLSRLALGNTSRVKSLGGGLQEMKFDFGPGYRVYFGYEGKAIVILLAGGAKRRQDDDIARALDYWNDYRARRG
ncbi:MAG: type II toxin-antitoxin system RelE/ParE family toxin [Tagaea sp.]